RPPRPWGSITSVCRSALILSNRFLGWPSNTAWARRRMRLASPCVCLPYAVFPLARKPSRSLTSASPGKHAFTGQVISLTKQRHEVLAHPERLESLSRTQGTLHVELIPRPKNRSNYQNIIQISNNYEGFHGPQLRRPAVCRHLESASSYP